MWPMGRFLGVKELSEYLGVARGTVYQWVHEQKIPYYKIGGLVKFEQEKIDRWIKKREVRARDWRAT